MAGVSQAPSRERYLELARDIQLGGGKVLTARHVGADVRFPEAIDDEARNAAERGARTCGCGDTRMVMISYTQEIELAGSDETHEKETRYVACVNCDAVHLQPRFQRPEAE